MACDSNGRTSTTNKHNNKLYYENYLRRRACAMYGWSSEWASTNTDAWNAGTSTEQLNGGQEPSHGKLGIAHTTIYVCNIIRDGTHAATGLDLCVAWCG